MKKIFRENGITLVALVVTIIILLILAGVSIASLTGNGLFEKAKLAKEKAQESKETQNVFLHQYEEQIDSYVRSGDSNSVNIYNLSELNSTYNPYGLNGFIKYDKNMEILEINIYYNKINISNLTKILNISFINNLPNLNFEGQDIWVPETADYMAGTGLAFTNSGWIPCFLSLSANKNIYIHNTTGADMTELGYLHCEIYLK